MAAESAGVLMWRRTGDGLEVLIAHPGGPFWANKDAGAWSIPKGLVDEGEELAVAAAREFAEETGHAIDPAALQPLGHVRLKSGKVVHGFAVEGDLDPNAIESNTFEIEWPPRSGRTGQFPEIDRVAWVDPVRAGALLNPALVELVVRLVGVDRPIDHLE